MQTAVSEPSPITAKPGLPWYIIASVSLVLCLIFGTVASDGDMWSWKVFWRWFLPTLLLVPVSVSIAAIPWSIRRRKHHGSRFAPFFLWTAAALTVLFVGLSIVGHASHPPRPAPVPTPVFNPETAGLPVEPAVPTAELSKIEVFDVEPELVSVWNDQGTMRGVLGRIRNGTANALSSVSLEGVMNDQDGKPLETVDITVGIGVRPGQAQSFKVSLVEPLERVRRNAQWVWRVTAAHYQPIFDPDAYLKSK